MFIKMNINEEDEDQLSEKKSQSRRNSLAKILAPQGKQGDQQHQHRERRGVAGFEST